MLVGLEAKARGPLLPVARPHGLQHADGDHVLGLGQRRAQRHGPVELAVVVLGLPGLAAGEAGVEEQRRVVDDGGGGEALLQRRGIDEGLEAGARLAPGLGGVVELVLVEVEAPHQRSDGAVARVYGHEGALHLGQLGGLPGLLGRGDHADDGAAPDLDVRRGLVREARLHGLEALARDLYRLAAGAHGHDLLGAGFEHHGREHVAVVRVLGQQVVDVLLQLGRIARQGDELLRAAVVLPPLVGHDALAQGLVGGVLFGGIDRGVDVEPAGVGLVAILGKHELARHLGEVLGVDAAAVRMGAQAQLFLPRLLGLRGGDETVLLHAVDDVQLPCPGALVVADRVVGRRCLGQAGQHRRLGDADAFQRLAEIDFRGCCKPVSTITQEDLIHVNLENLILGQIMLEFES